MAPLTPITPSPSPTQPPAVKLPGIGMGASGTTTAPTSTGGTAGFSVPATLPQNAPAPAAPAAPDAPKPQWNGQDVTAGFAATVSKAQSMGANSTDILNEFTKQNSGSSAANSVASARQMGAHDDEILQAVIKQNPANDRTQTRANVDAARNDGTLWTPVHGDIAGMDAVFQGVKQGAKDTYDALTGKSGIPALDAVNPLGYAAKAIGAAGGAIVGGINKVADDVTQKGLPFMPFTSAPAIGKDIRAIVGDKNADATAQGVVNAVNSPVGKALTDTYSSPNVKQGVGAVTQVANLFGTIAGAGEAGAGASEAIGALKTGNAGIVSDTVTGMAQGIKEKAVQSEKEAWMKPSENPKASYGNARDIATKAKANGHDIGDTLVNSGVRVGNTIEDGVYNTDQVANNMRQTTAQISNDTMRPALAEADTYTPKTSVESVTDDAIRRIRSNPDNSTAANIDAQVARAKEEGAALANKYPDGMSLTDMHDERINYQSNGKFSPTGDPATNIQATTNRALGSTLASTLDSTVPEGLGYKAFNQQLSRQFQAADYLDALNGKKVPLGAGARIAKMGGQIAGVMVGDKIMPGIIGDIVGYRLGGMLESTLQNVPDALRVRLLSNLQKTNPDAFASLSKYMETRAAERAGQLALPGPTPLGTEQNPIVTPPSAASMGFPDEQSAMAQGASSNYAKPPETLALPEGNGAIPLKGPNGLSGVPYEGDRPVVLPPKNSGSTPAVTLPTNESPVASSAIPKELQPLAEEARKYRSAEEFKRSISYDPLTSNQVTRTIKDLNTAGIKVSSPDDIVTLYHGTNAKGMGGINKSNSLNPFSYMATNKSAAEGFSFGGKGGVIELKVPVSDLGYVQESMAGKGGATIQTPYKLVKGSDGIWRADRTKYIPENLQESQLTDFYNQATGGVKLPPNK